MDKHFHLRKRSTQEDDWINLLNLINTVLTGSHYRESYEKSQNRFFFFIFVKNILFEIPSNQKRSCF